MKAVIIGGGASGIMAALSAAEEGAEVEILERLGRIGKKILATGNGRCNLTNINTSRGNYSGGNAGFISGVLHRFDAEKTIDFFESIGLMTKIEDSGKVYPYTEEASSVLDVLRLRMEDLKIKVTCNFEAETIRKKNKRFEIISYTGETVSADKVIVACGGRSSPSLGSNGSGYEILKKLGHTVTPLYPSLVQAETTIEKGLKGIKKDCAVSLIFGGKKTAEEYGEVLFTEYGLSGPPVFNLSSKLHHGKTGEIIFRLDIMNTFSRGEISDMLFMRRAVTGERRLEDFFTGFLNKRIIYAILKECGIAPLSKKGETLSDKQIYNIAEKIKNWDFKFIRTRGWNNSQVTKGGIPTNEVDADMQSKKMPGVYITGELLDADGECGGYNLQWAWSTGYIAGKAVCL